MTSGNRTSDTFGSGHSALEWGYEKSMVAAHTLPSRHREERNITDQTRASNTARGQDDEGMGGARRDEDVRDGTARNDVVQDGGGLMTRCAFEEPLCR